MPKMRIIIDIEETEGFNWKESFEHWSRSFPSIAHSGGLDNWDGTNVYAWTKQDLSKNPDEALKRSEDLKQIEV